jgi:hypothetical protein
MDFEDMKFPVYRKYKNNKSYFKIINALVFEEVQLIGSKRMIRQTKAVLYPEKLFIRDLLLNYHMMADEITEAEYQEVRKSI